MSSCITNLAASLASAIEKEAQELNDRRDFLAKEKEKLEEEKRRMTSISAKGTDLVKINVGGKVFQTHRATLLSAEGSLLEAIFSGRWEESLVRDDAGIVFFDFDPAAFRALLNYLRTRALAEPGQAVAPPCVPEEQRAHFEAMVAFMGLREVIAGRPAAAPNEVRKEAMSLCQAGGNDGTTHIQGGLLRKTGGHEYRCVVGSAPLVKEGAAPQKLAWKVSILQHSTAVLAGVTTNPAPPDNSYADAGTFGWASTLFGAQVRSEGRDLGAAGGWPGWQAGDVAILQLKEKQLRLYLRRTGQVYTLHLPAEQARAARLHFNLHNPGDSVEVSQVTPQELAAAGLF